MYSIRNREREREELVRAIHLLLMDTGRTTYKFTGHKMNEEENFIEYGDEEDSMARHSSP